MPPYAQPPLRNALALALLGGVVAFVLGPTEPVQAVRDSGPSKRTWTPTDEMAKASLGWASVAGWADERCPFPLPVAVTDRPLPLSKLDFAALAQNLQAAIMSAKPPDFDVQAIDVVSLGTQTGTRSLFVWVSNERTASSQAHLAHHGFVVEESQGAVTSVTPIHNAGDGAGPANVRGPVRIAALHETGQSTQLYVKTTGFFRELCWESVIYREGNSWKAIRIDFNTTDGFNSPVAMTYPGDLSRTEVTPEHDGDGWYVFQDFQDPRPERAPDGRTGQHLGEDWNGEGGGDTDIGYPVVAAGRGEVIYARDRGRGWNGVVVLRHRTAYGPPWREVFSLYGHLNVSPGLLRPDGTEVRTLSKVIRESSPSRPEFVEKGQVIGYLGPAPAGSSGTHLHFEIILDPSVAFVDEAWTAYRDLQGDRTRWTGPREFIAAHRSYSRPFEVGEPGFPDPPDGPASPTREFAVAYTQMPGDCPISELGPGRCYLGMATGGVHRYRDRSQNVMFGQAFAGGTIWVREAAGLLTPVTVLSPFASKWRQLQPAMTYSDPFPAGYPPRPWSNPNDFLGLPTANASDPALSSHNTSSRMQPFEGGVLVFHQSGRFVGEVFEIHGAIEERWRLLGDGQSALGLPVSDVREATRSPSTGRTGRFSDFEGGAVYWIREIDQPFVIGNHQDVGGATSVAKEIAERYAEEGGSGGRLGFPTTDDYPWNQGVRVDFEGGHITWTPGSGVDVIYR